MLIKRQIYRPRLQSNNCQVCLFLKWLFPVAEPIDEFSDQFIQQLSDQVFGGFVLNVLFILKLINWKWVANILSVDYKGDY